jgi:carbon-monoxide dehydrogenase medium subunit
MPIAHEFDYVKPASLDQAVAVLAERGEGAAVLAGGTDVVALLRDGAIAPEVVVDIKGIDGLADIRTAGDRLFIGPLVTFTDLIESELIRESFPLLYEMAVKVASKGIRNRATVVGKGIRNRATVVGNICSAVPSCDAGPVLLVYDARVLILGPGGERTVHIDEWFTGPKKTDLQSGELVVGLEISSSTQACGGSYVKLGRYRGEDLAQASVAVLVSSDFEYRVAFGAVGPTPVRARKLEAAIKGEAPSDDMLEIARKFIARETSPITDIRATVEYRVHMLEVMLERGIRAAVARLDGGGPDYGTRHI